MITSMKGNYQKSIDFLKKLHPETPWVLTAIRPDRKGIETTTFTKEEEVEARVWIENRNDHSNLYFHVNNAKHHLNKKASLKDIKSMGYLHVDIDPREGYDLKDERDYILDLLTEKLPKGIPAPTCVVFSGGGYQAFWKLEKPFEINGDLALADKAATYNKVLENLFKADNCHNVDRIMRLPGTINIPDARKIKKGRTPELSKVMYFRDYKYNLEDFPKPMDKQEAPKHLKPKANLNSIQPQKMSNLNELDQWNVPDRLKKIIEQGVDPEKPKDGDNSRSGWLFDVCCNLVRKKVPNEVILGIITDSAWSISESVLDKGPQAHKYALAQIKSAHEKTYDPDLFELNAKHAVVQNYYGKCRVILEEYDYALKRKKITGQSVDDFRNSYSNLKVEVGVDAQGNPRYQKKGHWWLDHADRRQYEGIIFAPGQEIENYYNLWQGFGVQAIEGDQHLSFVQHIKDNVCASNDECFQYLIKWMARAVQLPNQQGEVAVVLRGKKGTGKSFFVEKFGRLFGRHFLHVSNAKHLVGNFNAHLQDCVLLFADEAFYAGDKKHESVLKTLITESENIIERKGVDASAAPNFIHLIMASNEEWVVPVGNDERRYLCLDVGDGAKQNSDYFAKIQSELENGGYENLLYYLQNMNLKGWDHRKAPATEALYDQLRYNMPDILEPFIDWLDEGVTPGSNSAKCGDASCMVLKDAANKVNISSRKLLNQLSRLGVFTQNPPKPQQTSVGNQSTSRAYKLKPLAELRKKFANYYGGEWPDDGNVWRFAEDETADVDNLPF